MSQSVNHIAVVDYGMGNLHSVAKALEHVCKNAKVSITADATVVESADRVVFPGVGAIGVFVGCEYVNAQGQLIFSQYYPSGTANATAYVVTDPNVTFQVQADGAIAQTALGHNAPLTAAQNATTSVNTTTGKSNMQLDATTATATKSFKVVGFVTKPGSAIGDAFTDVLVKINSPYHQMGTGIVGE